MVPVDYTSGLLVTAMQTHQTFDLVQLSCGHKVIAPVGTLVTCLDPDHAVAVETGRKHVRALETPIRFSRDGAITSRVEVVR